MSTNHRPIAKKSIRDWHPKLERLKSGLDKFKKVDSDSEFMCSFELTNRYDNELSVFRSKSKLDACNWVQYMLESTDASEGKPHRWEIVLEREEIASDEIDKLWVNFGVNSSKTDLGA